MLQVKVLGRLSVRLSEASDEKLAKPIITWMNIGRPTGVLPVRSCRLSLACDAALNSCNSALSNLSNKAEAVPAFCSALFSPNPCNLMPPGGMANVAMVCGYGCWVAWERRCRCEYIAMFTGISLSKYADAGQRTHKLAPPHPTIVTAPMSTTNIGNMNVKLTNTE